jgi:hypothetical protein
MNTRSVFFGLVWKPLVLQSDLLDLSLVIKLGRKVFSPGGISEGHRILTGVHCMLSSRIAFT